MPGVGLQRLGEWVIAILCSLLIYVKSCCERRDHHLTRVGMVDDVDTYHTTPLTCDSALTRNQHQHLHLQLVRWMTTTMMLMMRGGTADTEAGRGRHRPDCWLQTQGWPPVELDGARPAVYIHTLNDKSNPFCEI